MTNVSLFEFESINVYERNVETLFSSYILQSTFTTHHTYTKSVTIALIK